MGFLRQKIPSRCLSSGIPRRGPALRDSEQPPVADGVYPSPILKTQQKGEDIQVKHLQLQPTAFLCLEKTSFGSWDEV